MHKNIPFNLPLQTGTELKYLNELCSLGKFSGDGNYTKKCQSFLEKYTGSKKCFLTTSCTHALELAALLLDIKPGDEVIMPSFTFVSTANPFVLRGAKIVFVDVRPDTMNMNESLVEEAITDKTRAIIPVHYAAIASDMDKIMSLAEKYDLFVVEDAAQAIDAYYQQRHLGTIGHLGALSFHDTKNIHCGEGGALLINDESLLHRAEIIRDKGTDRSRFIRGEIEKYSWVDIGSSYLPSELNAAWLLAQLESIQQVKSKRLEIWNAYNENLKPLEELGFLTLPQVPDGCEHNGHIYYTKLKDITQRQRVIDYLRGHEIHSVFHYVPLHSSKAGLNFGKFTGKDIYTTKDSERLLRLPLYFSTSLSDVEFICKTLTGYFND